MAQIAALLADAATLVALSPKETIQFRPSGPLSPGSARDGNRIHLITTQKRSTVVGLGNQA